MVLDSLARGHDWAVRWGELVRGDIADRTVLDGVFREYDPVAVMHFAAYIFVGESVQDPAAYYENNVGGAISLLQAMRRHGCRHLIFSSTAAVYGTPERVPIPEEHPLGPINPYGWTKMMIEQVIRDFSAAYPMRHALLRYFNAAGADPEGEIGEDHDPENHLIPLILFTLLGRRERVEVFGTDYDTPDGTAIRDYIHVADLVDAHVLALRHLLEGGESLCLNLGAGQGHTVREVIRAVERITGRQVPFRDAPRRAGDPPALVAAADKARAVLGWNPVRSDLDTIISTAWRWHVTRHGVQDAGTAGKGGAS